MTSLESYFRSFRSQIIGCSHEHLFSKGQMQILYADWAASGRLYQPIERYITEVLGPYVANTHTETTLTGTAMTQAYHDAHKIIKNHVNASADDCLIFAGFGMTAVVNKFQRMLGLRVPEMFVPQIQIKPEDKPLVIVTHMEHHSNQTSWEECQVDVAILQRTDQGDPDLKHLEEILQSNRHRKLLIGTFTACSNVTGLKTQVHKMAQIMHRHGGYCFIDYSASAPYVDIDMHPNIEGGHLDAIYFSPHKFLGGPGSSGVLIFNKKLYQNTIPDHPGGGTVKWTNPWGEHTYFEEIELREDGGTPGFLQAIKASLAVLLKEEMGTEQIAARERQILDLFLDRLNQIQNIHILENHRRDRLPFISFFVPNVHHNLMVKLLNDHFGIQSRGGCSCAGTYGHILLDIQYEYSHLITNIIDQGILSYKPGWVRISLHPTMSDREVIFIADAISACIQNAEIWQEDYSFDPNTGEFYPKASQKTFCFDLRKCKMTQDITLLS